MNKYSFSALIFSLLCFTLQGQNNTGYDQALVSSNKMIAVVIVLSIILLGIAGFLIYLERKIKKLEDQVNHK